MIMANAHPKCGTNLLKKVLGGYGLNHLEGGLVRHKPGLPLIMNRGAKWAYLDRKNDSFLHCHVSVGSLPSPIKMVLAIRNPRNALVSFLRWAEKRGDKMTSFKLDERCATYIIANGAYDNMYPWPVSCMAFAAWHQNENTCTVRFEELMTDGGASVIRIGRYVKADITDANRIYAGLYGDGANIDGKPVYHGKHTWSGKLSDWTTFWNERIDSVWADCGGVELEGKLKYTNEIAAQGRGDYEKPNYHQAPESDGETVSVETFSEPRNRVGEGLQPQGETPE